MKPVYAPDSRLRHALLKLYAWKEVELLRLLFWVGHWSILRYAVFRKPLYYLLLHFLGTRAMVSQAATLEETYRLFKQQAFRFLPARSVVQVDASLCRGRGDCVDACPFQERRLDAETNIAAVENCQGCGLCVDICPHGSNRMVPRAASAS